MARKEETEKAAASPENTPGSYPTPVCLSPGTRAPESTTQSLLKHWNMASMQQESMHME